MESPLSAAFSLRPGHGKVTLSLLVSAMSFLQLIEWHGFVLLDFWLTMLLFGRASEPSRKAVVRLRENSGVG